MNWSDKERFTPESAASVPLDSSQITGRGRERFSRLRLVGAALVGLALGVTSGAIIGVALWGPPIESIATPEAIRSIVTLSGLFGLPAAGWGAGIYYVEH